jgi:hypothetical protein
MGSVSVGLASSGGTRRLEEGLSGAARVERDGVIEGTRGDFGEVVAIFRGLGVV